MKTNNPALDKSYEFALTIVKLCHLLQDKKREFILSKQLMRSGTSIGANVEEAIGGQSNKDFLHKISIAYKEARESHYWIRLIGDSGLIEIEEKENLLKQVDELLRILGSIQKTIRTKINTN